MGEDSRVKARVFLKTECKSLYKAYLPGKGDSIGGNFKSLLLYYYDETWHPYTWVLDTVIP